MTTTTTSDDWNAAVNILHNVVFLDIQNVISLNGTYCFNLNIESPGVKKIVFRIRKWDIEEIEDPGVKTKEGENIEDPESLISEPIIASPCNLLTRRIGNPNPDPENPLAPWSYCVSKRSADVLEDPEATTEKRQKLDA
ncbi:hypothetical protein DEU56DRAFT_919751 [Suillus clintonianus]|uniref:uncharacterized protein n=1 Tax=Suillus clintonianus TaxID=1904413 RepID=UPI001B8675EA|nr:uncharacterized protein DEU56DRAFT_919751 [Suillus clintonianus]KAG2112882.1 hypothetical protein DEU56DRAFT_919751 [Suillus clintonianus]